MKILFITPYVPSRIRVRPYQIIKELSKRHQVHVISLDCSDANECIETDELKNMCAGFQIISHPKTKGYSQALKALPGKTPSCAAFCFSKEMNQAIKKTISDNNFDVLHIEHLRAAHFMPKERLFPVIFDSVDCLTRLFLQMAKAKHNPISKLVNFEEYFKLKSYEPRILKQFDRVIITNHTEKEALTSLDSNLKIDVVGNGVDTDYFKPFDNKDNGHRIIFTGKMSYYPNANAAIWFGEKVFPSLKERFENLEFYVVGNNPSSGVTSLESNPGITVTGFVEDLRPYLASSTISVAPMKVAVGIQNKALEAMAMSVPVVASSQVVNSLGNGKSGISAANNVDDYVKIISHLLENPQIAKAQGKAGCNWVNENMSWKNNVAKLEDIYEETIFNFKDRRAR